MRMWRWICLFAAAVAIGLLGSELLYRLPSFRDAMGRLCGRGALLAIVEGVGLYEKDARGGITPTELIVTENLRRRSAADAVDPAEVEREFALLRAQFGKEKEFTRELHAAGLSSSALRERIAEHRRALRWLEKEIVAGIMFSEPEARAYYAAHRDLFTQPNRFRAAHLLLAAHEETPPEVVEEKSVAIEEIAGRLSRGASLADLAAELSEDEATKTRGGDLGFFSTARMPPEFFEEIEKLKVGETSKPFQSHMGFHIVRLTERKPARLLSFEEAHREISLALTNKQRSVITERLVGTLSRSDWFRASN